MDLNEFKHYYLSKLSMLYTSDDFTSLKKYFLAVRKEINDLDHDFEQLRKVAEFVPLTLLKLVFNYLTDLLDYTDEDWLFNYINDELAEFDEVFNEYEA